MIYEIPDPSTYAQTMWGPTSNGEGWQRYERDGKRPEMWNRVTSEGVFQSGPYSWGEIMLSGPLTDEDPDPSLEELSRRVVAAAVAWEASRGMSMAAVTGLRDAVAAYTGKALDAAPQT